MSEPKWMTRGDVEVIHEGVIEVGGGAHGLRDPALLESALTRPQNLHAYGEHDHFQLAASYAEGISFVALTSFAWYFLVESVKTLPITLGMFFYLIFVMGRAFYASVKFLIGDMGGAF